MLYELNECFPHFYPDIYMNSLEESYLHIYSKETHSDNDISAAEDEYMLMSDDED